MSMSLRLTFVYIILEEWHKIVVSFLDIEVTVTHCTTQHNTTQKKKEKRHYNQHNKQQQLTPTLSLVGKILRRLCCPMSFRRRLRCLRWLHGVKVRLPALGHAWRWSCFGCDIRSITVLAVSPSPLVEVDVRTHRKSCVNRHV